MASKSMEFQVNEQEQIYTIVDKSNGHRAPVTWQAESNLTAEEQQRYNAMIKVLSIMRGVESGKVKTNPETNMLFQNSPDDGRMRRILHKGHSATVEWKEEPSEQTNWETTLIKTLAIIRDVGDIIPPYFYDIAACRPQNYYKERIWFLQMVGVQEGLSGVWRCSLNNVGNVKKFDQVCDLGLDVKNAAIAFDGDYFMIEPTQEENLYSVYTDQEPFIFTIENGNLYQRQGARGEKILLYEDGNLKQVAAERGFFPQSSKEYQDDQGLIVLFASEDKLHCATQGYSATGVKAWSFEDFDEYSFNYDFATNGKIRKLQIHRLNDYRIAWVITGENKTEWWIHSRTQSGMAIHPEFINLTLGQLDYPMHWALAKPEIQVQPNWTWEINEKNTIVTITSNMDLITYNGYNIRQHITGNSYLPPIQSVEMRGRSIIVTFTRPATSTFTIGLQGGSLNFAAKPETAFQGESGGTVEIVAVSHEFEIFLQHTQDMGVINLTAGQLDNFEFNVVSPATINKTQDMGIINLTIGQLDKFEFEILDTRATKYVQDMGTINLATGQLDKFEFSLVYADTEHED